MLTPNANTTTYAVNVPPTRPKLTPKEQALLESIMEEAEEKYDSETFYSVFQKLVDI